MFNTTRSHRWLTVPGALAVFAGLGHSDHAPTSLLIVPALLALPFIAYAAMHGTERATRIGLLAVRLGGWFMAAWSLFLALWSPVFGGITVIAAVALLFAAGTGHDERRLGAVTTVAGVLVAATSWLLVWIGADPLLLLFGAGGLIVGGLIWTVEVHRTPRTDDTLPAMTLVA